MNRLLTTVTAIATLAIPALALAHVYQDQNPAPRDRAARSEARQPAARPAAPARPAAQPPRVAPMSHNQGPGQLYRAAPTPQRQIMKVSPDRRQDLNQNTRQDTRQNWRTDQRQRFDSRQAQRQVWNRGDRNWWRGRSDFAGYEGRRTGYWFTPGYGYYRVDPRWYGFNWQVGGYVPWAFRDYYVQDIGDYGLPPAPYGYAYVYLDNDIVLMSLATGAIVQVVSNLY